MNLQHMYQAWQQGRPGYVGDWSLFVEFAAKQTNSSAHQVMAELIKTNWFEWVSEK